MLKTRSLLILNFSMVFLKNLFLDVFSSSYTPLLSVLSYPIHLYADDTQLFLSFSAADFAYIISLLELTMSSVYNWISSNFLSLNPSRTEFLLVVLPQQLWKLSDPIIHLLNYVTLLTVQYARNSGVIFDSNLAFLNTFLLFLNHALSYSWPQTHS
jgi:hypothetical protein